MSTLLDRVRQQMARPQGRTPVTETSRVQDMMTARTGRAVGGDTGPRATSIRAEMEADTGVDLTGQLQAAQVGAQQSAIQYGLERGLAGQQADRSETQSGASRQLQQLHRQYVEAGRTLDFRRDAAQVEQMGFAARLGNEQYVHRLQLEGQRMRLGNQLQFKSEMTRASLATGQQLFENNLNYQRLFNMNDRDFRREIGRMKIDDLVEQAIRRNREESLKTLASGAAGIYTALPSDSGAPDVVNEFAPPTRDPRKVGTHVQ